MNCFVYYHGRHTYWTNIFFDPTRTQQIYDYSYGGRKLVLNGQGGENVHNVIEYWLKNIYEYLKDWNIVKERNDVA